MKGLKIAACVIASYLIAYLMVSFYWVSFDPVSWSEMGRFMMLLIGFLILFAWTTLQEIL